MPEECRSSPCARYQSNHYPVQESSILKFDAELDKKQDNAQTWSFILKAKTSNLTDEISVKHHLHQVIKGNITRAEIHQHHVLPDVMHWGGRITFVEFLLKINNMNLIQKKYQMNPKQETFYKATLRKKYQVRTLKKIEELSWIGGH